MGFILYLIESGIEFRAADKPHADRWELLQQAIEDEKESAKISDRTKKALARAKARGVELGKHGKVLAKINRERSDAHALALIPVYDREWANGYTSEAKMMHRLNFLGYFSDRGNPWGVATIHALFVRIRRLKSEASNDNQDNTISSLLKTGT